MKKQLSQCCIHSLIIAPPDVSDDFTLECLAPIWEVLEEGVETGAIVNIGISDISVELFKELYEWAKVS